MGANDTKVKVEVKCDPGFDVLEGMIMWCKRKMEEPYTVLVKNLEEMEKSVCSTLRE